MKTLMKLFRRFLRWLGRRGGRRRLCLRIITPESITYLEGNDMKKYPSTLLAFTVAVTGLSAANAAASVDGALQVTSSDPTILEVTPLDDGHCRCVRNGLGTVVLTVAGDADLGDGVETVSQDFEFLFYDAGNEVTHFSVEVQDAQWETAAAPANDAPVGGEAVEEGNGDPA